MFESHFGLSAPPFQLNPDPTFYFGSKGHSNALAYLQYGVHQAEGFIVVTGEIGAGKTTLVRTLLEGLDATQVKAAQIASTQLDATGLLQAMLTAFGVPHNPNGTSKASLISTLEAFFMTLAIKNKRALLVVDEAQNLSMDAIEELRMLSNFQLRKQALLQSFLVGQPELRGMLESQRLEQLRQRVIASCHLGPLDADETRRYIEHRLNRVGWKNNPAFEPEALQRIYQYSSGIPRRINLLCNRLLLSAFLENLTVIGDAHVLRITRELRDEVGESTVIQAPVRPEPAARRAVPAAEPVAVASPAAVPVVRPDPVVTASATEAVSRIVRRDVPSDDRTVLCLVDSPAGYLVASLLAESFERLGTARRVVVVALGTARQVGPAENYADVVDLPAVEVHLNLGQGSVAQRAADAALRCEALLDEYLPDLVLPIGQSDDLVTCALVASRNGVPLLRVEAGVRAPALFPTQRLNGVLIDRMAGLLCTPSSATARTLSQDGVSAEQVQPVGSLTVDAVTAADAASPLTTALISHHGLNQGFILVTTRVGGPGLSPQALAKFVLMLGRVRGDRPMLWLVSGETQSALRAQGLGTVLSRAAVALASLPPFSARLSILKRSSCLIADRHDELVDGALALGLPVLLVDEEGDAPQPDGTQARWLTLSAAELGVEPATGPRVTQAGGSADAVASQAAAWLSRLERGDTGPWSAPAAPEDARPAPLREAAP